jgi:hypothetical protein
MEFRTARRIQVQAPYGKLIHEIRLSSNRGIWQARIITLPRQIWVEPGGNRALTFEASTAEEAETRAAEFIEKECISRGHRLVDPTTTPGRGPDAGTPARRLSAEYALRFMQPGTLGHGGGGRTRAGRTANLSETGLFIATAEALYPGSRLIIELRLPGSDERLEGVVVWSRMSGGPGREAGMGVRLVGPSLDYRARIQSLRRPSSHMKMS